MDEAVDWRVGDANKVNRYLNINAEVNRYLNISSIIKFGDANKVKTDTSKY